MRHFVAGGTVEIPVDVQAPGKFELPEMNEAKGSGLIVCMSIRTNESWPL